MNPIRRLQSWRSRSAAIGIAALVVVAAVVTGATATSQDHDSASSGLPSTTTSSTDSPTVTPTRPTETEADRRLLQPENFLGSNSVWKQDVSTAPVDSNSAAMVNNLVGQVQEYYGGTAAFNAYQYNVNWYNVSAHQATTTVAFSNCQHKPYTPAGLYGSDGQFVDVPIPSNAVPATGTDATLTIYRPSTDQLWELWNAGHDGDGWHACWGGRIDHVSTNRGYFHHGYGASATGLIAAAGDVSLSDVRRGVIDHAVYLAIPAPALYNDYSWPAQRSDGSSSDPDAIPEGSRLRLDPDIDVDSLHLNPLATMIAKAGQKYGFIVTNKAGAVTVTAESGIPIRDATGTNPWNQILGDTPPYKVLKNFPWNDLQMIQPGWGRTSAS